MAESNSNLRFIIDGGDGWPEFFYSKQVFEVVETEWFDNTVNGWPAILSRGIGGDFDGKYFAFTARNMVDFPSFLIDKGWASILVHPVRFPASPETPNEYALNWGKGMGVIVMLEDGQPRKLPPVLFAGPIAPTGVKN